MINKLVEDLLVAAAVDFQERVANTYGFNLDEWHLPEMSDKTEVLFLVADELIARCGYGPEDFETASRRMEEQISWSCSASLCRSEVH